MLPSSAAIRRGPGIYSVDAATKAAIIDGLSNRNASGSAPSAICPSGNCTFPAYSGVTHSSIGLCSKCVEVSSMIQGFTDYGQRNISYTNGTATGETVEYDVTVVRLPNGLQLNATTTTIQPSRFLNSSFGNLDWVQPSDPTMLLAFPSALLNYTVLTLTDSGCNITKRNDATSASSVAYDYDCPHPVPLSDIWKPYGLVATSCTMYPCVKNYHAQIQNGVMNEKVVSEIPVPKDLGNAAIANRSIFNTPCIIDSKEYGLANISKVPSQNQTFSAVLLDGKNVTVPEECIYHMGGPYAFALYDFIIESLSGSCYLTDTNGYATHIRPDLRSVIECLAPSGSAELWWLSSLYNSGNATFQSIDAGIGAIVTAVTNRMRIVGKDSDGVSSAVILGDSWQTRVCTQLDWPWLLFPAALLLLTALLLVVINIKTLLGRHDIPIWKSSILPLMFSVPFSFRAKSGELKYIDEQAERMIVSLEREGNGWEFVGESLGEDGAIASGRETPHLQQR
jgi:hypothetical protein